MATGATKAGGGRKRETYLQDLRNQLKRNIGTLVSNFEAIIQRSRCDSNDVVGRINPYTQSEQDAFESSVRAANMVQASEELTRLVTQMKTLLVLGDFCWLQDSTEQSKVHFNTQRLTLDQTGIQLRDKLASQLYAVEEEYYTGTYK